MAAANVDGELEVFCALYKPGEHFRLTLRFLVQPSEMRRGVMARRSDLAVFLFALTSIRMNTRRASNASSGFSATYADADFTNLLKKVPCAPGKTRIAKAPGT